MFARITSLAVVALVNANPALADHLIAFKNNCGQNVTPTLTNPFVQLKTLSPGGQTTKNIPEAVSAVYQEILVRMFGRTDACDGNHASSTPTKGYSSQRQCNVPSAGMH